MLSLQCPTLGGQGVNQSRESGVNSTDNGARSIENTAIPEQGGGGHLTSTRLLFP